MVMCFVSCGGSFLVTTRKPGPSGQTVGLPEGIVLPLSVSHKCCPPPPGNAVDQQLVEEIKRMNRGIAKGQEEGVEGCEGLYQSVSPQQASVFRDKRTQRGKERENRAGGRMRSQRRQQKRKIELESRRGYPDCPDLELA